MITREALLAALVEAMRASAYAGVSVAYSEAAPVEGRPLTVPPLIHLTNATNAPEMGFRADTLIDSLYAVVSAEGSQ